MPTYNYKCKGCKIEFSVFQGINDEKKNKCPQCKTDNDIERMITGGTGMIFKGDGFYITDYVKSEKYGTDCYIFSAIDLGVLLSSFDDPYKILLKAIQKIKF